MAVEIRYEPYLAWGAKGWVETGDLHAYYTNVYGAELHGYIWLGTEAATVGVTGVSSKTMPFGGRAIAELAINNLAYRTKVVETAKRELAVQFAATNKPIDWPGMRAAEAQIPA